MAAVGSRHETTAGPEGSQAGSHVAGERLKWIGTPCRVRLDIGYLFSRFWKGRRKGRRGKSREREA